MAADRDNSVPRTLGQVASLRRGLRPSRVSSVAALSGAALVTGCVLVGAAGAAAPQPPPPPLSLASSLSSLHVTRVIVSPTRDALLTRTPVRLVVRAPADTSRLQMVLNGRSSRLRVGAGRRAVAILTARSGLRTGLNHVLVTGRRGRYVIAHGISFSVLRPVPTMARLRLGRAGGSPAAVAVTVSVGPSLRGARLGAIVAAVGNARRRRVFQAWVNGRPVGRRFDAPTRSQWSAILSVSDGLRAGCNQLRVFIAEPVQGRYAALRRRFCVPTGVPLAGVGPDQRVLAGTPVRLDGRVSRAVAGGALRFRWTLITRPRGSRAMVRRASSPQPSLVPDRPGFYRLRLTVIQRRPRGLGSSPAARAAAGRHTSLVTTVIAQPSLLVPFATNYFNPTTRRWGVKIGSDFYENPGPGNRGLQVLTIDRHTLAVTNTFCTGDAIGTAALLKTLQNEGLNDLVILASPPGPFIAAVQPDAVRTFQQALAVIGAPPVDRPLLTKARQPLSIIGTPTAAAGSGWFNPGAHVGWLALDSSARYAFTPATPMLDTSAKSTPSSNSMTVGSGAPVSVAAPQGGAGWQVVGIDPVGFNVGANRGFDASNLASLPGFVNGLAATGSIVAVQSFGSHPVSLDAASAAALERIGASSSAIAQGTPYAFVGGPRLSPDVLETNGSGPGRIVGRAHPRHSDGVFILATHLLIDQSAPAATFNFALDDILHQSPQPWPYTPGGTFPQQTNCPPPGTGTPDDVQGYASALAYITANLRDLETYAPNVRSAYLKLDRSSWSGHKTDLSNLQYPSGQNFTQAQWCNLKAELQTEFDWLDSTKDLFDSYKEIYNRAGGQEQVDLQTIGQAVVNSMPVSKSKTILFDVLGIVGELANFASFFPEEDVSGALISSIQSALDQGTNFATDDGSPIADQINAKVQDLSNQVAVQYSNVAAALDNERDIVITGYGRLSALGPAATSAQWAISDADIQKLVQSTTLSAKRSFTVTLLPLAWHAYVLNPTARNPAPTTQNCVTDHVFYYNFRPFHGESPDGQVLVNGMLLALGHGDPANGGPTGGFRIPSAGFLAPLFTRPDQGGLGLYKPWLFLRNFAPFSQATCDAGG